MRLFSTPFAPWIPVSPTASLTRGNRSPRWTSDLNRCPPGRAHRRSPRMDPFTSEHLGDDGDAQVRGVGRIIDVHRDPVASTKVVMIPMLSGCKTTVTVKLALAPNAPRSQPTAEPLRWQLPCEDVTETKVAASELGRHGIRVNVVAPGAIQTPLAESVGLIEVMGHEFLARTPLGKPCGMPSDVAGVVSFLCGEDAAWITGETLSVDGGNHIRGLHSYWDMLSRAAK